MRWVIVGAMLGGCGPKDWREAVRSDTSAGYREYIRSNPTSYRVELAERRAEKLAWEEAVFANTGAAYHGYAVGYPRGEHVQEALAIATELMWAEARGQNTTSALQTYVDLFPASPHRREAEDAIEDLWYQEAVRIGTEPGWSSYLARYPEGRYAVVAHDERDKLVWKEVSAARTRTAYQRYVKEFPTGLHRDEAEEFVAQTYFRNIRPVVALVGTWQSEAAKQTILARVRKGFDAAMVPELSPKFRVLPTEVVDATHGMPHPHELYGQNLDVGLLVIEWSEALGREFEPRGHATDVRALIRVDAPNTPNPVSIRQIDATTPDVVRGVDESTLHQGAVDAFYQTFRTFSMELRAQAPKEGS